jgi:hypothetical protein
MQAGIPRQSGQSRSVSWPSEETRHPKAVGRSFNDGDGIAAMDLFAVPTISFRLLYGLLIVGHGRRQILWFGLTPHPTQNGSQIRSPAGGNRLPAISFVTGMEPTVRSLSEGFDQWAFAIDRRRRAVLGKMDMLKG